MRCCGFAIFVLSLGCMSGNVTGPFRSFTVNLTADDPTGLYVFALCREQEAAIDENLTVELNGNALRVDEAFLKGAQVVFQHRGKPLGNGLSRGMRSTELGLQYFLVRRDANEIWYYVGTWPQYAGLDREGALHAGPRIMPS